MSARTGGRSTALEAGCKECGRGSLSAITLVNWQRADKAGAHASGEVACLFLGKQF